MLKIFKKVFLLPVIPLLLLMAFYLLYLMYKNTNMVDFYMFLDKVNLGTEEPDYSIEQDIPTELVEHLKSLKAITRPLLVSISVLVWYWIITTFIL